MGWGCAGAGAAGGLAEQPIWAERAKANDFGLPSFSAYPGEPRAQPPHFSVAAPGPFSTPQAPFLHVAHNIQAAPSCLCGHLTTRGGALSAKSLDQRSTGLVMNMSVCTWSWATKGVGEPTLQLRPQQVRGTTVRGAGPAVAGAGEYLLMLPQLLEGALDMGGAGEGTPVDGDWLDKVALAGPAHVHQICGPCWRKLVSSCVSLSM